ncbi:hypothetical protein OEZ86_002124 [Tetradesmus obliquus]|nr:hypothetical protein OEZ86_002124 [Tetradesmus obliquus]
MERKAVLLAVAWILLALCVKHASAESPSNTTAATASAALDPNLEQKPVVEQLMARKQALAEYLKGEAFQRYKEKQLQRFSQQGNQRGVLIVAGGRDMFANAAVSIMMLRRHLRSSLPVEIVHYGESELSKEVLPILQELNSSSSSEAAAKGWASGPVFVTDALQAAPLSQLAAHHKPLKEIRSFPAKVYALTYATRFQQVLLMDADSMPLIDPAILFDVPSFKQHGDLFWSDFWWNAWVNSTIYNILGGMQRPPWENKPDFRLVDSGQILFDRMRHAEVLEYLWLLNSHHEWVYKHMHGDKDTFLLAFAMAGRLRDFKQVPCFVRDALTDVPGHKHRYHHLGMVQSLPPGVLAAAVARASRAGLASASMLLHGAANATAAAAAAAAAADVAGSSEGLLLPRGSAKGAKPGSMPFLHIGVPVVFHRTSFNSKFFPDCLDKKKIADKYCQIQYVTVPMSNERSGYSLKPNMYAFNEDQRLALQQIGTPPEWQCESLQVGQSEMPIPALKVELFGHMAGVLQQSYEVFREVRERLKL